MNAIRQTIVNGELESEEIIPLSPIYFKPFTSRSSANYGVTQNAKYMILLPKGTDIKDSDIIESNGKRYAIETFYDISHKGKRYAYKVTIS